VERSTALGVYTLSVVAAVKNTAHYCGFSRYPALVPPKPKRLVRDPLIAAAALTKAAEQWQREADALRITRNDAVRASLAAGHTQTAIAEACGLSSALVRRIQQEVDR